jgi:hypothetical protein
MFQLFKHFFFVFSVFPTGYYCGLRKTRGAMVLLETTTQQIKQLCARKCEESDECLAFNFRVGGNMNCQLISGSQLVVTEGPVEWTFYRKCLQHQSMCQGCIL